MRSTADFDVDMFSVNLFVFICINSSKLEFALIDFNFDEILKS